MGFKLLVLQHAAWDGPGHLLLSAAEQHDLDLHIVPCWQMAIPDPNPFDALIILGGPSNVDQETSYPFLRQEKSFLRTWLSLNRPCLAFQLGHHLLAHCLQAGVGPNFTPSIGFIEGHLTSEGKQHPLFHNLKPPLILLKRHNYAIMPPLPRRFSILATSRDCMVEAFSLTDRPNIVGVQFNNHAAHPDDLTNWTVHAPCQLSLHKEHPYDSDHLVNQASLFQQRVEEQFMGLINNFTTMIAPHSSTPPKKNY